MMETKPGVVETWFSDEAVSLDAEGCKRVLAAEIASKGWSLTGDVELMRDGARWRAVARVSR